MGEINVYDKNVSENQKKNIKIEVILLKSPYKTRFRKGIFC